MHRVRDRHQAAGLLVSAEAGPVLALQEVAGSLAAALLPVLSPAGGTSDVLTGLTLQSLGIPFLGDDPAAADAV